MSRTRQGTDYKSEIYADNSQCLEMTMRPKPEIKPNSVKHKTVVFDLLKNEEFIIEPWVPDKKEVFRMTTEIGKRYEYAEYTERTELPVKYFAPTQDVKIVGTLVKIKEGGFGDGGWRIDVFDNNGETTEVKYSYEGRTCFNEL